ncbi:hypothetical protein KEM55_008297, partial [Ascosphaera atra]
MVSAGVWAGKIPLDLAHSLVEVPTVASKPSASSAPETVESALESIGYKGSVICSHDAMPMAAHFELHIEQGPHLVSSGQKIGI